MKFISVGVGINVIKEICCWYRISVEKLAIIATYNIKGTPIIS
jgi:hypothetical protein